MAKKSIEVKATNIVIGEDNSSVVVNGEVAYTLMTALVQRHDHAMKKLSSDAPSLSAGQIQMDRHGNVVIKNTEFTNVVKGRIESTKDTQGRAMLDLNVICNILC